ncbi:MAG: hypothetical protein B6245_22700 [Desulfobacteraceae bacterium 4572_88]|nr:MAG: hypothetical protein B6245_22700 [Desulfobacteraceae bacterium 4572_88]
MISVRVRKGYDLNIKGKPSLELEVLKKPSHVAALPEKIPFVKPRLLVKTGDRVSIGTALFEDKRNPDMKFLSPGGGQVSAINFGPRRVIREVVIKLDENESGEEFRAISENEIEGMPREELLRTLMNGGENGELFRYGLLILRQLCQNVHVGAAWGSPLLSADAFRPLITHICKGEYPATHPGVLCYHTKTSAEENRSWYVRGQDVLLLAHLLKTGTYPTERIVAVGGSSAKQRRHVRTRIGVPLRDIAGNPSPNGDTRYVVGGTLTGYTGSKESYLGFYETALTLLPEGLEKEAFGFVRPGFKKPSYSRTFLSAINPSDLTMNCNLHGDVRACVNCGTCASVCPVDILPQFTMKCVLADEVEESLEHGLLDCVECGLCSYVCPSKIELRDILRKAKAEYYKELEAGD